MTEIPRSTPEEKPNQPVCPGVPIVVFNGSVMLPKPEETTLETARIAKTEELMRTHRS